MIVGIPKEVKEDEYRVAMLPVGVEELVSRGHEVLVQTGALKRDMRKAPGPTMEPKRGESELADGFAS